MALSGLKFESLAFIFLLLLLLLFPNSGNYRVNILRLQSLSVALPCG